MSPTNIYKRPDIKYGYPRIKSLLSSLNDLREDDGTLPENYVDILF